MLAGNASMGGCAYIDNASPSFINCRFEGCRALHPEAGLGGAIYVLGAGAQPKLQVRLSCGVVPSRVGCRGWYAVLEGGPNEQLCASLCTVRWST